MTQKEKAELLRQLHHRDQLLVLPNIWNPLGALLLEDLGYPAIATASASVALSNGFLDGENIPLELALQNLKRIAAAVDLPVTADFESAYSEDLEELYTNILRIIEIGIVGINIEDSNIRTGEIHPMDFQVERIRTIKSARKDDGVPLVINARTDLLIRLNDLSKEEQLKEILKRGKAYKAAGADCFFPVLLKAEDDIRTVVTVVGMPVNIIAFPGIPPLKTLQEMGVARVSLGPGFLKTAIKAMRDLALQLKELNGLEDIVANDVTSDYLKLLAAKANIAV
jgi:2-methylisocitrate lyase-like PEP mutase family enzyme